MTKKELSQLYWLNREIAQERRKLEELEAAATSGVAHVTGMPSGSSVGRSVESYATLIAEAREIIDTKVRLAWIEYNRLNRYIMSVDDARMRRILSLRYVDGMTWYQVAMSIGGGNTEDSVRKAHDRFLEKS